MKNFFILITLFVVLSRLLLFFPSIPIIIYYIYFFCLALFLIIQSKTIRFDISSILFLFIACLSIFMNDIPSFFKSEQRLISFLLLISFVGPLFYSNRLNLFKIKLFKSLCLIFSLITVFSFLGYLIKIPIFMIGGLFNGLTIHSMLMGPVAGITSLICIHSILNNGQTYRRNKIKIGIFLISILTCLLSGSRSSFACTLISILFYLKIYYSGNWLKFFKILVYTSCLVILSSPFWIPYTETIMNKQKANEQAGGTFSSREVLWEDRIDEFTKSPLWGVGFSSMDINIARKNYAEDGTIEPGSGWLFILSSMGIMGFFIFLKMILFPVINIYNLNKISDLTLIASMLVFFMIHLCVEGYVTASGSFLFFLLWITIGLGQREFIKLLSNERSDFLSLKNINNWQL